MNPVNNTGDQLRTASNSLNSAIATPTAGGKDKLAKDDFLKLLMAQVSNQDPLNPMDSEGMMNQLTQMGSLEQMIGINEGISNLHQVQADIARANAYTFLDKDVSVRGGAASVIEGRPTSPAVYDIPREAAEVKVAVIGPGDAVVRSMLLGQQPAGSHEATWDGLDEAGNRVVDGNYRYEVLAKGTDGESIPVDLFSRGKVSGIRFENGRSLVKVNGRELDVRNIVELSNQSQRLFGGKQPLPVQPYLNPKPPRVDAAE
jgi:flagellar basal-body rod modification protein FlgD